MNQIVPFDFEEQAVRTVMQGDEPWFVAADVCRILEIGNTAQALSRLDDDEKGIITSDTLGGAQKLSIISESGLYALVFTSRKEEAKRFRKWVTGEVLPALRRSGAYALPQREAEEALPGSSAREIDQWLGMIREARLLGGVRAGRAMWSLSPLPPLSSARAEPGRRAPTPDEARACLDHLLNHEVGEVPVWEHLTVARRGGDDAEARGALAGVGVKVLDDGAAFIAGPAHDGIAAVYRGTAWAGAHAHVMLAMAGVERAAHPHRIDGYAVRGVIVPADLTDGS